MIKEEIIGLFTNRAKVLGENTSFKSMHLFPLFESKKSDKEIDYLVEKQIKNHIKIFINNILLQKKMRNINWLVDEYFTNTSIQSNRNHLSTFSFKEALIEALYEGNLDATLLSSKSNKTHFLGFSKSSLEEDKNHLSYKISIKTDSWKENLSSTYKLLLDLEEYLSFTLKVASVPKIYLENMRPSLDSVYSEDLLKNVKNSIKEINDALRKGTGAVYMSGNDRIEHTMPDISILMDMYFFLYRKIQSFTGIPVRYLIGSVNSSWSGVDDSADLETFEMMGNKMLQDLIYPLADEVKYLLTKDEIDYYTPEENFIFIPRKRMIEGFKSLKDILPVIDKLEEKGIDLKDLLSSFGIRK